MSSTVSSSVMLPSRARAASAPVTPQRQPLQSSSPQLDWGDSIPYSQLSEDSPPAS